MAYRTITVSSDARKEEAIANAAITPGMLIELMSTAKVKVHATSGGNVTPKSFAIEDELQGNGIATAYAANARCFFRNFQPGDLVYAMLANGENVAIGDKLMSNGDGYLKKLTDQTESIGADSSANITTFYPERVVGIAQEALDMSDSSAADPSSQRFLIQVV
jgi:hypothetical protein